MIQQINVNRMGGLLTNKYGVNLHITSNSSHMTIRPSDLPHGQGFEIRVSLGWRSVSAEFFPDNYSAALLRAMGLSDENKKALFKSMAYHCISSGFEMSVRVNGTEIYPLETNLWPKDWAQLYIRLNRVPVVLEELTLPQLEDLLTNIGGILLGLTLSLLPLEDTTVDDHIISLPEGAVARIEVNRYERNALNREACIMIHGCSCKVCGLDFERVFGTIGRGFIHVHHVVPVSVLGQDYIINPAIDLVPVCPNCHAMIHRRNPPFTVEELKGIILANK